MSNRLIDIMYDETKNDNIALSIILETIHDVLHADSLNCIEEGENTNNGDSKRIA